MNKIQYIGIKENGKSFRVVSSENFKKELNALPKGRYRLTVERYRKNKSNAQLGYLFAVIYPFVLTHLNDAGWEFTSLDEVDAECKRMFASKDILNRHTGEIMSIPGFKREMTTTEFAAYVDAIRQWDAEYLGGTIPEPETNLELPI